MGNSQNNQVNNEQLSQGSSASVQKLHSGDGLQANSSTTADRVQSPDPIGIHLDDIKKLDDIPALSVRQLKVLLATNRVSYHGATEKEELIDLAKQLWKQKQKDDSTKVF